MYKLYSCMYACIYDINKRKNLVHVKRVITAAEQEQKITLKKMFDNKIMF